MNERALVNVDIGAQGLPCPLAVLRTALRREAWPRVCVACPCICTYMYMCIYIMFF